MVSCCGVLGGLRVKRQALSGLLSTPDLEPLCVVALCGWLLLVAFCGWLCGLGCWGLLLHVWLAGLAGWGVVGGLLVNCIVVVLCLYFV